MTKQSRYDVFISHASEDKRSVARPLASTLRKHGLKVWYDEFTLNSGDDLRASIDIGIKRSRFGIVILSPWFFKKKWTKHELAGLTMQEMRSSMKILPVWHNVSQVVVQKFSPTLASKVGISTNRGLVNVVKEVERIVQIDKLVDAISKQRQLQVSLAIHIKDFLIQLGAGFQYVDKNVRMKVGDIERSIDLLFYHTKLRCYIVIELNTNGFQPELTGKMLFLINAVDSNRRQRNDSATIGIILCSSKNESVVDLTLRGMENIKVAEYWLAKMILHRSKL